MRARIRDFLETVDGWIFAVADYSHPEGLRCLLRYIPDPGGARVAFGTRYRKMDFDESFQFLRTNKPEYIKDLHVVPEKDVRRIFLPSEGLKMVAQKDSRVRAIVETLEECGIPRDQMGITGSMLLGLQGPTSDIDFVVYGPHWWKARDVIAEAKKGSGPIQDLDDATWKKIYNKRKPEVSFQEFVLHEKRKGNRGMVDGIYFDLLFTRDWAQIKPNLSGKALGRKKVVGVVTEADFAFDSPAIYRLEGDVEEIYCYSHTYAGQAVPGETVEACGVLEEVDEGKRLVVGTTREAKGEWIRSLTLLGSGR